jgi:hypothetical protein
MRRVREWFVSVTVPGLITDTQADILARRLDIDTVRDSWRDTTEFTRKVTRSDRAYSAIRTVLRQIWTVGVTNVGAATVQIVCMLTDQWEREMRETLAMAEDESTDEARLDISDYTRVLMRRRGITEAEVREVLAEPDVVYEVDSDQKVYRRGRLDVIVTDGQVWSTFRHPEGRR